MTAAFKQSIAMHCDTLFFSFIEERIKSIGIHHRMKVCYRFDKPKNKKKESARERERKEETDKNHCSPGEKVNFIKIAKISIFDAQRGK